MNISINPISGALGAEVSGVDLARPLSNAEFDAIHSAFLAHHVLFFLDQTLTPHEQLAFARRWGDIHVHPYVEGLPECPEVLEILKTPTDTRNFGGRWHSDQMFSPTPAMCTMLYARELPPVGGDTLFANLHAAFDGLSPGMRELLANLKGYNVGDKAKRYGGLSRKELYGATMSAMKVKEPTEAVPTDAYHPLVRTHPETGRKALYIGSHTQGLENFTDAEATPLLEYLQGHCVRPEYTCRFRWRDGAMAMWDNRSVQHFALNDYAGHQRRMHRVTIKGDVPF
ncbi:MAG: TauD/TfdA family dioxygenase [Gammaproteobacteria bacterium]|nr:TauD/TfdA family dioxygenase [Gammaproteobacteria bacterium]